MTIVQKHDQSITKPLPKRPAIARPWHWPALLVLGGLLAYANSFAGVFLLDDHLIIEDGPQVRSVAGALSAARPLVNLTLALNYALGRTTPWGYHVVNLAIHLLAGLTLYSLLRRTLRLLPLEHPVCQDATGLAFAVALLWVVHPLQTQAVTYIVQRSESLMGLFYLLTLYCTLAGAESEPPRRGAWYVGAVLCCALGMVSKEIMVTAPLLTLLYDRIFLGPSWREVLRRRWPLYLGLATTWLLLAGPLRWAFETDNPDSSAGFGLKGITPLQYLCTQAGVVLHYLRLIFWPQPLCLDYQWPIAQTTWAIVGPGLVIVALLLLTAWALWRQPWLGFWGAWFFIILAPTSSFMPIADIAFEHRLYLPLAGVLVLAVLAIAAGVRALAHKMSWDEAELQQRQIAVVGLLAVVSISLTYMRNVDYRSEQAMWNNVLQQYPDNVRAHYNLGRAEWASGRVEEAHAEFREALRLRPEDVTLNLGYAIVLFEERRYVEAEFYFLEVRRLNPRSTDAANYLDKIRALKSTA
jgi:hypothetical protein